MIRAVIGLLFLAGCSPPATPMRAPIPPAPSAAMPNHQPRHDAPISAPPVDTTTPADTKFIDEAIAGAQRARDAAERRAAVLEDRAAKQLP
jgi:hypothetical protein